MGIFDEDQLYSMPVATPLPDSALFSAPSSGIGMADIQEPAPVEDRSRAALPPYIRLAPSPRDQIRAEVEKMSGVDKFFAGLGEFGAGVTGRPSPLMQRIKQQREEKILRLQEIKIFNDTTKDVLDNADRMEGDARTQYLNERAASLDSIVPGSGDMLKSLSDDSGYGKMVLKYAGKSETLKMTLETGGMPAAVKLFKSTDGKKLIQSEIESAALPDIRTKLTTLGQLASELLSPEELKKVNGDGFISPDEAALLNQRAMVHEKYKVAALSEEQLALANKHQDATYALAGFATSKTAQDIIKKRGEETVKTRTAESTIGKIKEDLKAGRITQEEADAAIRKATIREGTTVNLPTAHTETFRQMPDGTTHKFVTQIGRDGTVRQVDVGPADAAPTPGPKLSDLQSFRSSYFAQPIVKQANDLDMRLKPLADYVVRLGKTKVSENAWDLALGKMYLSMTRAEGDRVLAMDKNELKKLPSIGDRVGNAFSSFFAGKDLTDVTRKQAWDVISGRWKSAREARQAQRVEFENVARERGYPIEKIFGAP